jgi:spore maturation protein SpmB
MMLTNGPDVETGAYTGKAYEGIGLLPWLADKCDFVLKPLFGFSSGEAVAVPVTALGAAGAAIGLVDKLLIVGKIHANDIAVFTAMCMCWSGYLSTHVSMMNSLKSNELIGRAIFSHTIGGLCAGVAANWIFALLHWLL